MLLIARERISDNELLFTGQDLNFGQIFEE
jgi:hypothetical protein